MQSRFSWGAFCVAAAGVDFYADWIARGRPRPSHATFAKYIAWAIAASGATLLLAEVTEIRLGLIAPWQLMYRDRQLHQGTISDHATAAIVPHPQGCSS
jgi:mycobactin lysine-N-oxygenase